MMILYRIDNPGTAYFGTSNYYQKLRFVTFLCLVLAASSTTFAQGTADTLDLTWHGSRQVITKKELLTFVPPAIVKYNDYGTIRDRHHFVAQVWPASDSGSLSIDTSSSKPPYLFVLYNTVYSVLVVLKRQGTSYVHFWKSPAIAGEMGYVQFKDLNGNGRSEVIVNVQLGVKLRPNIMLFSWNDGVIRLLNPTVINDGFSEFRLYVDFLESDTGLTIRTIRSDTERTYFYGKNSSEIKLISEARIESKD